MQVQELCRQFWAKWFYTQLGQQRVCQQWPVLGAMPKHGAKAPGVVQQKPGVVKQPLDVVMLAAWLIQRHASQRARHAEVDDHGSVRSEERRVGKECVSTCRSRWSPDH